MATCPLSLLGQASLFLLWEESFCSVLAQHLLLQLCSWLVHIDTAKKVCLLQDAQMACDLPEAEETTQAEEKILGKSKREIRLHVI